MHFTQLALQLYRTAGSERGSVILPRLLRGDKVMPTVEVLAMRRVADGICERVCCVVGLRDTRLRLLLHVSLSVKVR